MNPTGLALDPASLAKLRQLAKRLATSQSEVVHRALLLLEQREAATPADALNLLAEMPSAMQCEKTLKARISKQRAGRHAADEASR